MLNVDISCIILDSSRLLLYLYTIIETDLLTPTRKNNTKQKALSELNQIGLSDYSIARYYLNGIYCTNASIAS